MKKTIFILLIPALLFSANLFGISLKVSQTWTSTSLPDTKFGTNGSTIIPIKPSVTEVEEKSLRIFVMPPQGAAKTSKIVLCILTNNRGYRYLHIRLNNNGTLDTSFNHTGILFSKTKCSEEGSNQFRIGTKSLKVEIVE